MSLNFTPTDTTYRYAWTDGHAEFRRDLVRLFRCFTPGRYLLTVCIQRGETFFSLNYARTVTSAADNSRYTYRYSR